MNPSDQHPSGWKTGPFLILAAAVLWGTAGTAQAFAPPEAQAHVVGALRLAIGGLTLLAICLVRGTLRQGLALPWKPAVLAALCMASYQVFFFMGVIRTGVAVGTIVAVGSAPVTAGIISVLAGIEKPGPRWAAATAMAVMGCYLLAGESGEMRINLAGIIFALIAGASYAAFAMISKQILVGRPPEAVMAVIFCIGGMMVSPLILTADLAWAGKINGLTAVLHLGIIATGIAYVLFAKGLTTVSGPTAVTLSLGEPMTAALLGTLVLKETLNTQGLTGILLIFSGLLLLTVKIRSASRNG